ncbi:MAG: hypothetical protein RLN99_14395, partial [Kiloniellaceae bacterium]
QSMGFAASDCVLVQDDVNLPAGVVRARMNGSDGGHLGVRSALIAFQTSDIRRVKVGVQPGSPPAAMATYLVSPFPPEVAAKVTEAREVAAQRLLAMAEQWH